MVVKRRFLRFIGSFGKVDFGKSRIHKGGFRKVKLKTKRDFYVTAVFLAAFVLWTLLCRWVDVKPIGPQGSVVGLASVNRAVHALTGVHMELYVLTDWLSLIPLGIGLGFAFLGLAQWIRRRKLRSVDPDILILGGFYGLVMGVYGFFEVFAVNYRPVLIEGRLEVSYPSSTTVLVLCVMMTAVMQMKVRIKSPIWKRAVCGAMTVFSVFMVTGRLISGVHWFTDIIGGILLGAALVMLYRSVCGKFG